MRNWRVWIASALPVLLVSCQHAPPPAAAATPATADGRLAESLKSTEHREMLKAASQRLDDVRKALKAGDIAGAEAGLLPLVGQGLFENEVTELRGEIRAAKDKAALEVGKKEADRRAFTEVDQRYTLPSTYGSTVAIDGQSGPLAVPPGAMEELFKRKVDISVQNAGVKELVQALTQIEGLNIIADDALEAKKALTINAKNTPLSEILSYIARNMGIAFHLGENVVWVTESAEEAGAGPKLETQVYRLRQGFIPVLKPQGGKDGEGGGGGAPTGSEDTELEDAIESIMADSPEGASYRVFKNRNLLMVRNSRENLRLIEKLIEEFDKKPQQVLIEARFLTISQEDLLDLGAEITNTTTPALAALDPNDPEQARVSDFVSSLGALTPETATDGLGGLTIGGILGNRTYQLVLSALAKNASTHTLSAPRVTVLNNQSARIRRGDKILYYNELETVAASGGGDGGSAAAQTAFTGTPEELELGVTLEVKVNIGNDGQTVMLGLLPEVIELKGWRAFNVVAGGGDSSNNSDGGSDTADAMGEIELPETTESVVNTTVAVKSGETVALGGMIETTKSKQVKKVPYLGDIPYLGALFRHTTEKDSPRHLLIFVTATVIDPSGQFVKVREAAP